MLTYTKAWVDPVELQARDVDLIDIAHSLALQCRYGGHVPEFYSVAEHSVRLARLLESYPADVQLWGLLHDGAEAYLSDVVAPLKHLEYFQAYRTLEQKIEEVIKIHFNLGNPPSAVIRFYDLVMLATEQRDFFQLSEDFWTEGTQPLNEKIIPWTWQKAEQEFLDLALTLMNKKSREEKPNENSQRN
jgi:hypothetical protein